jgi:hypothetical protein
MSAVRNWLEAIGLAQYADAFEANDIDTDLLTQIDPGQRLASATNRIDQRVGDALCALGLALSSAIKNSRCRPEAPNSLLDREAIGV